MHSLEQTIKIIEIDIEYGLESSRGSYAADYAPMLSLLKASALLAGYSEDALNAVLLPEFSDVTKCILILVSVYGLNYSRASKVIGCNSSLTWTFYSEAKKSLANKYKIRM